MQKLKQVLAQEDTVLFIGSGISMWSGLPSWAALIEELAKFVEANNSNADLIRNEATRGELLQAASYGFDKLTKQQIGEFVKSACRYGEAKPHDIHQKIVSLGPRCFITTNYDNLIEESLRKWQPDRFLRPPISNRQLTETAEIISARAIDFIFKPHGDAADSESIILTREQYRQLLPGGERQAALESLKTLLASRPVVYLGFGLRDPDFMYVRDVLANTYKGGVRDHYAILADISDEEINYWRRNYGIHLYGYTTVKRSDGTRDHTQLITLLEGLVNTARIEKKTTTFDPADPNVVLALARYSAGLSRTTSAPHELKLNVHIETSGMDTRRSYSPDKFHACPVEEFLDNGPKRALLIGLPGAGKTYALRQSVARLAENLHQSCLVEPPATTQLIVPIFVDLKLYQGDLEELISRTLPASLPLNTLVHYFQVKLFLDSFNEMPREYWESGAYESDFTQLMEKIGNASFLIGSRTNDGLAKFEFPAYSLDQIDEETISTELQRLKIQIHGRFGEEVVSLLQRPFYFQYIANGQVKLPKEAQPRDFYKALFSTLQNSYAARFGPSLNVEKALSLTAYEALNRGEEAFPLTELTRVLKACATIAGVLEIDTQEIANWLVSSSILIPYTGGRVAFVHQSITEYLAATELAGLYKTNPHLLKEKLRLTRWDQALFLTLSLLPKQHADTFLQDVISADFSLALNASKYLEVGRDEVVTALLSETLRRIENDPQTDWQISAAIERGLPLTDAHELPLRAIARHGNMTGGAAIRQLVKIKGEAVKDEFLHLLVEHCNDYNFCRNGVAPALKPFAKNQDIKKLAMWATELQTRDRDTEDHMEGFASGAAAFMNDLDIDVLRKEFLPYVKSGSAIHASILCDALQDTHTAKSLSLAADLLLLGAKKAPVTIYFIGNFAKQSESLSWEVFTIDHVRKLLATIDTAEMWSLRALRCLCLARPDLAPEVIHSASQESGIRKALLLHSIPTPNAELFFETLHELTSMSISERTAQPIELLRNSKINWANREELLAQLLKTFDIRLISALLDGGVPVSIPNIGYLDIGPADLWIRWLEEITSSENADTWPLHQVGSLISRHTDHEMQSDFVAEFNRSDTKHRKVLSEYVLIYFNDLTTDDFSEDAISYLLADLARKEYETLFRPHVLASTSTERFINERLLPLLASAKAPLRTNIHNVLRHAGRRHGKRYLLDEINTDR